jgi:hypothetical protein
MEDQIVDREGVNMLGEITFAHFAATLLLPVVLMSLCMAYFQLKSQGYHASSSSSAGGKGRFSTRDLLVFCTLVVAIVATLVIAMRVN